MNIFFKTVAGIIVTVFLFLVLPKESKGLATLMTIAACCAIASIIFTFLTPVIHFADSLIKIGTINSDMVSTLLKAVGICLVSEFTVVICNDAGNATLAKITQLLSNAILLYISIPYLSQLINIAENLLSQI